MPEFRLDFPKPPPLPPLKRSFITKNEYSEKVKVVDWDRNRESEPKDYSPFDPPGGSLNRSTYVRFGTAKDEWTTETHEMLEQIKTSPPRIDSIEPVPLISYGTYKETKAPDDEVEIAIPGRYYTDYVSTMKASYKPPVPFTPREFVIKETPWMLYRRMAFENPKYETNKFLDDCSSSLIRKARIEKRSMFKSYDTATGMYTDGTKAPEIQKKRFELPYKLLH